MFMLQVTKDQIFALIDQLSAGEQQEILQYLMNKTHAHSQLSSHPINQFAGKVKAFEGVDPVAWQKQVRSEWDEA
jgi:hypothetical protein